MNWAIDTEFDSFVECSLIYYGVYLYAMPGTVQVIDYFATKPATNSSIHRHLHNPDGKGPSGAMKSETNRH